MNDLVVRTVALDNPEMAEQWKTYAQSRDPSLGYFVPAWLTVFKEAFGHDAHPLAAFRQDTLAGILPLVFVKTRIFGKLLVSLPFVNYGGILADDPEAAGALAEKAGELGRDLGAKSIELRQVTPSGLGLPAKTSHKASMVLDLPNHPDLLWKGFKDKVRNQVRKAGKCGLEAQKGREELLDAFYRVFAVNMRDLGTPVYSRSFFSSVLRHFPDSTEILCVMRDNECVASGILYAYGNTMQMPWASSLASARTMCPNHLLYWETLRTACAAGYARFDFGRSTPDSGPWRFKKQWGAQELPLHWEYILQQGQNIPGLSVSNPKFRMAIEAWKRLPLAVANRLGPVIVRGIP